MATVHKDIRIPFTLNGLNFEAVGFLNEGEPSVTGDEMLRRVPDAVGDEDEAVIAKCLANLSPYLQAYCLATKRCRPENPRHVSCFGYATVSWSPYWRSLAHNWYDHFFLVVRRCT